MQVQQDNTSKMHKAFLRIASDAVSELREASDRCELCTPFLIAKVQDRIVAEIGKVYFGTHEYLAEFSK